MIKLPIFNIAQRIVTEKGTPTGDFLTALNAGFKAVVNQSNTNEQLIEQIQEALERAGIAIDQANDAAAAANAVVIDAALINSYVSPDSVLSASLVGTTATITVASHTRVYGAGTTIGVNGANIPGLMPSTIYYIYYVDPARNGGTVTYFATIDPTDAAQGSGKHCVGSIQTPAIGSTGTVDGVTTRPPGVPYWKYPSPDQVDDS
jgi:hypothetical protein